MSPEDEDAAGGATAAATLPPGCESPPAGVTRAALRREQHGLLLQSVRTSTLPTLLVGLALAAFYALFADFAAIWWWWLALCACLLLRARVARPLTAQAPHPRRLGLDLSLLATGLLWAAAPLLVSWRLDPMAAFAAILLAAGIAIAAFGAYAIDRRAAALVTLPIGAAVLLVTTTSGLPAYYPIALAVPLLFAHQFAVMAQTRRMWNDQIALRLENALLIEQLNSRADRTAAELDRRLETERELRASRDRAEYLSGTDGLTGIANRREFDKRLETEIARAVRHREAVALVIADMDYFKQFNDRYGHQKGDECLGEFARVLESVCRRGGDLAARIGGEEFALLLPGTTAAAAAQLAEQARVAFEGLAILHRGSDVADNATASFGVSSLVPAAPEAGERLYFEADRALYGAKRRGRNRVVSAAELRDDEAAHAADAGARHGPASG